MTIYRFEDFELDTTVFELRRGDEIVHIEPQVFSVLAHLVEHRDRVVSKIELLDEVWLDRFVSESALTSRIQAARKACEDTGREQRVIQTRHGRGYRFVAEVEVVDRGEDTVTRTWTERSPSSGQFVGRNDELATVDRALAGVRTGSGDTVFIGGAAGVGKSTLVEEAVERSEIGEGVHLLRAQCRLHEGLPEPYVSLLDAVGRFGRDAGRDVVDTIASVAPNWLLQMPSLVDAARAADLQARTLGGTHHRMLREGVDLFEAIARSSPVVLIVEDLHWADTCTLEVIEWLAGRPFDVPLALIGTFRPGGRASGKVDEVLGRLSSNARVEVVQLGPLDDAAVRSLALQRLDVDSIDDDLADLLAFHSGGSPLFVIEEIDLWVRDQSVVTVDGRALAPAGAESLAASVPDSVRRLIEQSFERLERADRDLVEAASVVGTRFPAFAVAAGLDEPLEDVERRLARLARQEMLINAVGDDVWPDGTVSTVFRLSHDLHRQILYDGVPTSRRAGVHQRVGERMESAYGHRCDEHVAELARHFLSSGDVGRGVQYLERSGVQALARSAHHDAVAFLRRALDLLDNLPVSDARDLTEIAIRASLGPALIATIGWGPVEVPENYERALALCESADSPPECSIVRFGLASVHEFRGEYNRSEELLREQLDHGPDLGVETHELLACSTFHQGAFDRALTYARAGLDLWDQVEHSSYMARYGEHPGVSCNTWGALSAWYLGKPGLAEQMAAQAVEWGASNEYALSTAFIQYAFLNQYRGDTSQCRRWADRTTVLADEQGFPFRTAQAQLLEAWSTAAEGDAAAGVAALDEAFSDYCTFSARIDEPYYLGLMADAALRAGQVEDALGRLGDAARAVSETTRTFFYEPELTRLRAVAVARQGDVATTELLLGQAAEAAAEHGARPSELRIALTRIELGVGGPSALEELRAAAGRYAHDDSFLDLDRARELVHTTS